MKLERIIGLRNNKTIYREGDKCIKVFDSDFSKANVLNEALNQAKVEQVGLNVPKIKEVSTVDGKWAIVSDYINGKPLSYLMSEKTEKLEEYLNLFVDLHISVLSKNCDLVTNKSDKLRRLINIANINLTTKFQLTSFLNSVSDENNICHGDFHPSNIVITDNDEVFVLDWSHVSRGNKNIDVVTTYLKFYMNKENELAEKYLNLYCDKTGFEKEEILKFVPVVAASLSTKASKEEQQFLLSLIK